MASTVLIVLNMFFMNWLYNSNYVVSEKQSLSSSELKIWNGEDVFVGKMKPYVCMYVCMCV